MKARRLLATVVGLALLVVTACASSANTYALTATFSRAVGLYEGSPVLTMGLEVGRVTSIDITNDGIVVTMAINNDISLRRDVQATIVPKSVIGERNVVLGPTWRQGDERLEPGSHIPVERTALPVEPDDALAALTDLVQAIDPDKLERLVSEAANAFDGAGPDINMALSESGDLLALLAAQDDTIAAIASHLASVTGELSAREADIARLLGGFSQVTDTLVAHRSDIRDFLAGMARLMQEGESLVSAHADTLPGDLENLAAWALTIDANVDSAAEFVESLDGIFALIERAFNREYEVLNVTLNSMPTLEGWVDPLLDTLVELGLACFVPEPPPECAGMGS